MTEPVRMHETHSAVVLLVGDRAYKVKKPVDLGFLDFTTLASRRLACLRELELNRRLAPDVYLDVATLDASDGTPMEPVLVMARMPEDARLSTRARDGDVIDDDLRAVARAVATLHADHPLPPDRRTAGGADELLRRWDDLLGVAAEHAADILDGTDLAEIRRLAHDYVAGRRVLLDRRAADGHVVDGHGDLRADDVFCLPDGPRILDCLDFDDRLRAVDVLDDVAFLCMDLEHLGRREEARDFLRSYLEFSGTDDRPSLVGHYVAYRAFVRATVEAVRADQGDPAAASRSSELAALALRRLRASEVTLVLVGGAPGTGKSTTARLLGELADVDVLSSDAVRRELFAGDPNRYAPWAVAEVYDELRRRARDLLVEGRSVVLDATWGDVTERRAAAAIATGTRSRLLELECCASVPVASARAAHRAARGDDDSEADAVVATQLAAERDPWPEATVIRTDDADRDDVATVLTDVWTSRSHS